MENNLAPRKRGMNARFWARATAHLVANLGQDVLHPKQRHFTFTKQWLTSGLTYEQRLQAPKQYIWHLFPLDDTITVSLDAIVYHQSNANPFELFCLIYVAKLRRALRIFEIGTFDGATTLDIARNCPDAMIFTLDLPPDLLPALAPAMFPSEVTHVEEGGVGSRFRDTPEATRITQLYGDSRTFDYRPYWGTMDIVFIDACHEYPFVTSDSQAALRLVRPGGVIFWHDYVAGWPGVVQAINELLPDYPIKHIDTTSLAVLDTTGDI